MLRIETVRPELLAGLQQLMALEELKNFYLVGGTGLSLIYGHRNSEDIDLFTHESFDSDLLFKLIDAKLPNADFKRMSSIFLFIYLGNVKVDFVNNLTPLQYPVKMIDGIRIADEKDIASLKLKAIFQRGSKKDFVDLFILLQHFSVEELLNFFSTKFPKIDIGQLLISMQYFEDAEATQLPELYIKSNWENIKTFIAQKIIAYLKN
jgi:predicted nucleotidyltransferase component of viral defense system